MKMLRKLMRRSKRGMTAREVVWFLEQWNSY